MIVEGNKPRMSNTSCAYPLLEKNIVEIYIVDSSVNKVWYDFETIKMVSINRYGRRLLKASRV
jgi:hypothetical protein